MTIRIGIREVGEGHPCYLVAEIGINHNGSVDTALRLIDACADAGFDAVKFQKRTVEVVYSAEELARPRESVFGATNGDLKRGLEFGRDEYDAIDKRCRERGIAWFASCWDADSVEFIARYEPPCWKVASAMLTHGPHLRDVARRGPVLLSTGMSTMDEIRVAGEHVGTERRGNLGVLLHSVSTYPCPVEHLNLRAIETLRRSFGPPLWEIGWSGHETGVATSVHAASIGAVMVERHVTLDRAMWGSDQSASLEPPGFNMLVRNIRNNEKAMGDGQKRIMPGEAEVRAKLRRVT